MLAWLRAKEERMKLRIDDLPIFATSQFVASAILSSEFNGPVAHGST